MAGWLLACPPQESFRTAPENTMGMKRALRTAAAGAPDLVQAPRPESQSSGGHFCSAQHPQRIRSKMRGLIPFPPDWNGTHLAPAGLVPRSVVPRARRLCQLHRQLCGGLLEARNGQAQREPRAVLCWQLCQQTRPHVPEAGLKAAVEQHQHRAGEMRRSSRDRSGPGSSGASFIF